MKQPQRAAPMKFDYPEQNIDADALQLAFNAADLAPVHPVHPKRLLRALR